MLSASPKSRLCWEAISTFKQELAGARIATWRNCCMGAGVRRASELDGRVADCGRVKELRYDPQQRMSVLDTVPASQASAWRPATAAALCSAT